jgi:hypothetical protein
LDLDLNHPAIDEEFSAVHVAGEDRLDGDGKPRPRTNNTERVLFDLVKQFSKMDPEDPEWLRYKLNVVECRAMENMARALNEAATEQAKLRGVTREIADFASTQIRGTIENAASQTRQMLEDVQLSLHDAISGEAILES